MSAHLFSTTERSRIKWTVIVAALLILAASISSEASELNPDTLAQWDDYIQAQNARMARSSDSASFLWSDQSPDRLRRLRAGEILVAPMGQNPRMVPHGLIHHWIGAIFLPHTNLDAVLTLVRDYNNYKKIYAPNVVDSQLLSQTATHDAFSLRMLNKAVLLKFALETEFQSSYERVDEDRWYSVGESTRIREIEDYGQAAQHESPPNTGRGFIWRLYNVSRFQHRDGGVYVELEAVALSRDVPGAVRWLVNPVVRRVSKDSMLISLQKTQQAILASNELARANKTRSTGMDKGFGSSKALVSSAAH
jgi:hypothetical protein